MEVLTVTKSEVIKEFFKKSVLPVAVAALLYCIFKSACTKDGVTDYVWLFILCGLPFGIPRMFAWIVPGGSLGTALPLFLLNFIIGGVIGGFVLVWRLLVSAWYIPLTIYRLFIRSCISGARICRKDTAPYRLPMRKVRVSPKWKEDGAMKSFTERPLAGSQSHSKANCPPSGRRPSAGWRML